MKSDTRMADWAIKTIENEFREDVCLLLEHSTLKLDADRDARTFSFYIPATNRANGLARTFIVDGIGYDLFPRTWDQIERMADVKEYNTTCLADAQILWARSDEDRQRFASLQARLRANLQNPQYMLERARAWVKTAKDIFVDMVFEDRKYKVRAHAGYICDLLALAAAFVNGQYFVHGQTNQLQVLASMRKLPTAFAQQYEAIIRTSDPDAQKKQCRALIQCTEAFVDAQEAHPHEVSAPDFSELAAWYQELCYTWRRVYHWCDQNDPINAYLWCCYLQSEVDEWGGKFGIANTDIFSAFSADDLSALRKRAEAVETEIRQTVENNGVVIEAYDSVETFLAAN